MEYKSLSIDPAVLWLTGLSGAGKSTLSSALLKIMLGMKLQAIVLDGDELRSGINSNLGFSEADRCESNRRVAEVAKLFFNAGYIVICACISPLKAYRKLVREILENQNFMEVFVDCSITECIRRDPKGLYAMAQQNKLPNFTGLTAPYEVPESADLTVNTQSTKIEDCCTQVIDYLYRLQNKI